MPSSLVTGLLHGVRASPSRDWRREHAWMTGRREHVWMTAGESMQIVMNKFMPAHIAESFNRELGATMSYVWECF